MLAREKLGKSVTIRISPVASAAGNTSVPPYSTVEYTEIVDDIDHPDDPNYRWLHLEGGGYVNYMYPPNGLRFDLLTEPPQPEDDPIDHIDVIHVSGEVEKFVPA